MGDHGPNKSFHFLGGMFRRCCDAMLRMTEFLLFFVMVIITYEVVARYIFKSPTIWVVDISRYCLVYITFLGATSILLKGEHINVDIVLTMVNQRGRCLLQLIGHILSALAFLVLMIYSVATTWDHYIRGIQVIDPIEIPKVIPLVIIPIGSLFLMVGSIVRVGYFISEWKTLRGKEGRS